jgi:thioredoxin-related protein
MSLRTFLTPLGVVLVMVASSQGSPREAPEPPSAPILQKFDPTRDAAADIKAAISEATRTHRRILLDVGGEWCIWCRRLDSLYASHKNLADYVTAHYVVVKVNYSKENKNESVLSKYPKIPGYPHYFVLESDGTLLHSQDTGALEAGKGHDPAKVLAFLKKWAE